MSGQSTIPAQVMTEETTLKGISKAPRLQGHNKALTGHQPQEPEEEEALEEGLAPNPGDCSVYSAKIKNIQQGRVTIQKQKEIAKAEARQN
jgi:hypothetical protein